MRTLFERPTLSTINSTKLRHRHNQKSHWAFGSATHPLQLMNEPIAPDSRHEKPIILLAKTQPPNLPQNDRAMMAKVNPQVTPKIRE